MKSEGKSVGDNTDRRQMAYTIMANLLVLWITFNVINISFFMVITWLIYGAVQTFSAGFIFARFNP